MIALTIFGSVFAVLILADWLAGKAWARRVRALHRKIEVDDGNG